MTNQEPDQQEDFEDLFVDKNLFAVFKASPTIFSNRFNGFVTLLSLLALVGFACVRFHNRMTTPGPDFVGTFSSWATVGWTLSSTLLGFLVAGFALLCTVLRPSAVVALHRYKEEGDENNALRNLFMFFVDIFISYLTLLIFSLTMVIATSAHGPYIELRNLLRLLSPNAASLVGYSIYVLWGTWFIVLVLKLKSFVYNLYQALMIGMTESVHSVTECANIITEQQIGPPSTDHR